MSSEDDEIIQAFLVESQEGLDQLDRDLVDLEQHPDSRELLSGIFRTIHTIKGTSGFLALSRLESVAHAGENLLSLLRDNKLVMTPPITEGLLRMVDAVRSLLEIVARTDGDADESVDVQPVIDLLHELIEGPAHTPLAGPTPTEEPETADAAPDRSLDAAETHLAALEPDQVTPEATPIRQGTAPDRTTSPAAEPSKRAVEATVRVDVELLDTLVRLVGELVLTRNQILQQAEAGADAELVRAAQRLNIVASELQEGIMRTRMQPIGQAWTKFPRVVRDLAAQLGKTVRLTMSGQETELDRTLLEAVKDPLTHLVRNSIDHGIEPPQRRLEKGKPEAGTLSLRAHHESGQVVVEISDDGAGLDSDRIRTIAVQRGVVSEDQLERMSEREIHELIFRPGFSTAAAVTNVSGRGVGMDVVRTNIESIGGVVDLNSTPGLGTTIRVRIPLTLAIIPALVVAEDGERFAIPQANLVELVRLDPADVERDVHELAGVPILRLRGQLLPLVSLSAALGVEHEHDEALTVVVVQADNIRFGLAVDEVHDTQEIVVKPLGRQLKTISMYAGATIMGDGRVALILDVSGMAAMCGITAVPAEPAAGSTNSDTGATTLLVLDVGGDRRAALPLERVSRLEEFAHDRIERSGATEVVQYRDGILRLVRLADAIGLPRSEADHPSFSVVVHEDGDERVGIVADRVVDIVQASVTPTGVGLRSGVLGTAVVQDKVTDLVDLDAIVSTAGGRS